jgi:hypothetical protein
VVNQEGNRGKISTLGIDRMPATSMIFTKVTPATIHP